jgi:hypothetical protein
MRLALVILSALCLLFAFGLLSRDDKGSKIAAVVVFFCGLYAYDNNTFIPFIMAWVILKLLSLMGLEPKD